MRSRTVVLAFALAVSPLVLEASVIITIINGDPTGKGFNDTTPAAPIGGNTGSTPGEQRLIAFQAAADKWGGTLNSAVPIRVLATWEALNCTETSGVLGSAGAGAIFRDFPNAPRIATWYSKAQANALTGFDLSPGNVDIRARFNVNLGSPGCLTGTFFYLGLDNNHGSDEDLVTVLTHEFAHGLGFQTYTNGTTGLQAVGFPSAWDYNLLDTTTGKTWDQMTDDERAASALRTGKLVWNGPNVNSAASNIFWWGSPSLRLTQPDTVAGSYAIGVATFGPALTDPAISGEVATFVDTDPGRALACESLSGVNAGTVTGKIALIDRGICAFVVKVANLQAAGAIGVIIADNVAGSPPPGLFGSDSTIQIPSVRISQADGEVLRSALAAGAAAVLAVLGINPYQLREADTNGHVVMYATDPFQGGSSVSHFDTAAFPHQLMGPFINPDLTHEVTPPYDLTYMLLRDIGWPATVQ